MRSVFCFIVFLYIYSSFCTEAASNCQQSGTLTDVTGNSNLQPGGFSNINSELPIRFQQTTCFNHFWLQLTHAHSESLIYVFQGVVNPQDPPDIYTYCVKVEGITGAVGVLRFCPNSSPVSQFVAQTNPLLPRFICYGREDGECFSMRSSNTKYLYRVCCCKDDLCNGSRRLQVGRVGMVIMTLLVLLLRFTE